MIADLRHGPRPAARAVHRRRTHAQCWDRDRSLKVGAGARGVALHLYGRLCLRLSHRLLLGVWLDVRWKLWLTFVILLGRPLRVGCLRLLHWDLLVLHRGRLLFVGARRLLLQRSSVAWCRDRACALSTESSQ